MNQFSFYMEKRIGKFSTNRFAFYIEMRLKKSIIWAIHFFPYNKTNRFAFMWSQGIENRKIYNSMYFVRGAVLPRIMEKNMKH